MESGGCPSWMGCGAGMLCAVWSVRSGAIACYIIAVESIACTTYRMVACKHVDPFYSDCIQLTTRESISLLAYNITTDLCCAFSDRLFSLLSPAAPKKTVESACCSIPVLLPLFPRMCCSGRVSPTVTSTPVRADVGCLFCRPKGM